MILSKASNTILSKALGMILSEALGITLSKTSNITLLKASDIILLEVSNMITSNPSANVQSFIIKSLMFNFKNDIFKKNIISSKFIKLKNEFERIERVKTIIFYVKNFKFDLDNKKRSHLKIFKFENDNDFFFLSFINT